MSECDHCNGYGKCKCINCFREYFDESEVTDHEFASFTDPPEVPCECCKGKGTVSRKEEH